MPLNVKDMLLITNAIPLTQCRAGTQTLVKNIINESNASNIAWPNGRGNKSAFFNHTYDKDPAYAWSKVGCGVTVDVYYQPASDEEYDQYDVVDKAVGMLSARARLLVRTEDKKVSFYTCSHPKQSVELRTGEYAHPRPIDTSR